MAIKLIASDLDGTIVDEYNKVAPDNLNAIHTINSKNVNFAISTGKTYGLSKDLCHNFNASYGIFGNGMQIIDLKNNKEIYANTLSKEDISTCVSIARKYNLHIHLYTDNALVTEKLMYMDLRNSILNKNRTNGMVTKVVDDIEKFVNECNEHIYKFIISSNTNLDGIEKEILQRLNVSIMAIKKYNEFKDKIIDKEYEYLDIGPKDITKGSALNILKDYLNISNDDEVMAIGDSPNDITMLNNAGVKVALSNAFDDVKNVASYITTKPVGGGGFAEAIHKYIV